MINTTLLYRLAAGFLLLAGLSAMALADDDKKRAQIDADAKAALDEILADAGARALYDRAVAYAVFDNTKAAFGVSGGGGRGVGVEKSSGHRTYMKMGTVGVGFGIGVKKYNVLMLFENPTVYQNFVEKGWQGETQASAAAGNKGVSAESSFHDGMAIFVLSQKGLMANADVSGTKYWKSDLN